MFGQHEESGSLQVGLRGVLQLQLATVPEHLRHVGQPGPGSRL